MLRWFLVVVALTGCDKIFGFATVNDVPADAPPDASNAGSWAEVAAGEGHTCAIRVDGSLYCWGRNDQGQLGIASMAGEVDDPTPVPGTWKHVATLFETTCAIDGDDVLWCWGLNVYGQAGTASPGKVRAPQRLDGDTDTWKAVTTGNNFACGITTAGVAKCWGLDSNGELGAGDTMASTTPRPIDSTLAFDHIDSGASETCAIATADHTLWCWGYGGWGQLGQGDYATHMSPVQVGSDAWMDVSLGDYVSCGVLGTGHLRCWGIGYRDELGNTATMYQPAPGIVGTDSDGWMDVEMSAEHACAVRGDGAVWCWGENDNLQLANTNLPAVDPVPTAVPGGPSSWLSVAVGYNHFCGLGADHALWCMGLISNGALGDGTGSIHTPVQVIPTATQIALGASSTCAVDSANARLCWGVNDQGQLGDGTRRSYDMPTHIGSGGSQLAMGIRDTCVVDTNHHLQCAGTSPYFEIDPMGAMHNSLADTASGLAPWATISLTTHTCAINTAGALYCWGYNAEGEVGNGVAGAAVADPTLVDPDVWSQVAVADNHSCGLSTTSGFYCWGYGPYGEIGDNMAMSRLVPTPVQTTATTGTILAAGGGSCLLSAGALSCWGYNPTGALGTGALVSYKPVAVTGSYSEVSLGRSHTCGLDLGNQLWCWGSNAHGELGDGTFLDAMAPRQVGTDTWLHISVGDYHTCGLRSDGSAWCWGYNDRGQVGVPRLRQSFVRVP